MSVFSVFSVFNRQYFNAVFYLTRISLRRMYNGSYLGILWSVIQPALFIVIMSIVMGTIMKFPVKDYALLFMSGLVPWTLLTSSCTQCANSLVNNGSILKSTTLPKTMFVTADVLLNLLIYFISFVAMYSIITIFLTDIRLTVFLMPLALIPLLVTTFAMSTFFAYLAPYIRDTTHVLAIIFQALFWLTPIAYPASLIPEDKQWLLAINPFYILLRPIQKVAYYGELPNLYEISAAITVALLACIISVFFLKHFRKNVIYYL